MRLLRRLVGLPSSHTTRIEPTLPGAHTPGPAEEAAPEAESPSQMKQLVTVHYARIEIEVISMRSAPTKPT